MIRHPGEGFGRFYPSWEGRGSPPYIYRVPETVSSGSVLISNNCQQTPPACAEDGLTEAIHSDSRGSKGSFLVTSFNMLSRHSRAFSPRGMTP
jgi:hypothetical protein